MCGILCVYSPNNTKQLNIDKCKSALELLQHRGPSQTNDMYKENIYFGHKRLSIIDLEGGNQPLRYEHNGIIYTICYNGEIYNMNQLKEDLINLGYTFSSMSDTEVVLVSYIAYGKECEKYLDGIFGFVIHHENTIFCSRDHLGVKPVYYYYKDDLCIIASEIKAILHYLGTTLVDKHGLVELLALGPSITPGKTIYKDIYMLRSGHHFVLSNELFYKERYWILKEKEHLDNFEETKIKVRKLVNKSVHQQLLSDVPICTMLSGGLDSSIITALASQYIRDLSTYSITYEQQNKYFKANDFQVDQDDYYIGKMQEKYTVKHQTVVLSQQDLIDHLEQAMIARDMPGMADIDSSLLLFNKEIKRQHVVAMSGECADEIFGGYPWFYKEHLYNQKHFPWMQDIDKRLELLNANINKKDIKDYIYKQYKQSLQEIQHTCDIDEDSRCRRIMYLNSEWFMQTLLTRGDTQSMQQSIELRVPFASKEIFEYMYNVPWKYIHYQGKEKGLLREAFKDILPSEIYNRKKNPYPKTHSPIYASLITKLIRKAIKDKESVLHKLFDTSKLIEVIDSSGDSFSIPWFGQLMTGPQLLAYFYQIHLWAKHYHVQFVE